MENFSLPSALHGFLTDYCSFSPHMLLSTVQCLVQVFPASLQKCANLENLEQRNIFTSPEIEDILLPYSLVSGVCYIAVG